MCNENGGGGVYQRKVLVTGGTVNISGDNLNDMLVVFLGYTEPCSVAITGSHISR
jgi:hypothetical protein